jgi:aminoglycoside phosphotransferase (APT) family kinase protein
MVIPTDSKASDVIDVRPDEKFNEQALTSFIKGKFEGSNLPLAVKQFGGGAANLTYNLLLGDSYEYVLRRPPLGPVAKSAHDMGREYKVLSVLHKSFPYAPRALLYSDDPAIIGSSFFIMERKRGLVIRKHIPKQFHNDPEVGRRLSEEMVDRLVDFHNVNYHELDLDDLGKPEGFIERQVEGWYGRWQKAKHEDFKVMDDLYNWLRDHIPTSSETTLLHNDYKLDNCMFDNSLKKMVAIFDWDMATIGDPFSDLGALLAYWYDAKHDPPYMKAISTMPTEGIEFLTRKELLDRYQSKSGRSVHNISFYHTMGLFRLVVIIAQIYIRYVRGQTKDQRFAGLGQMIPLIAQSAMDVATGKLQY